MSGSMAGIHKTFLKRAVSSQRLRAVVVDYEVLCKSTVASAPTTRSTRLHDVSKPDEALGGVKRGSLLSNVRGLLNSMTQSETEQGRRVQTTLAGLPSFMRATILGEDDAAKKDKHGNDDDVALHDKLVDEMQRKPSLKSAAKVKDPLALEDVASDDSSVRAKYLAKMNALKQRAKLNAVMADSRSDDISSISSVPSPEPAPVAPTKHDDVAPADMTNDLPKRKVNEHTNVFLSYIRLRGLALGVIPPTATHRQDEFQLFVDEVDFLDAVMDDAAALPLPAPMVRVCSKLELAPKDVIVISSSHAAISSGRYVQWTCRFFGGLMDMPV
ncbi:hypothetical protein, variant 1 [Aphanomyces astaci]|uniref:Uncharacterized protein n=2 Tax=Aphanomyces astaci TaxID=112090 RepID=W4H8X5_APHAT|nr:hypothetical protein, variant 1 [Aphanomyces astaci]ETV87543.1 hypothetical protein, variant 1 [Aphanomyces astaci]|eukprot:XP_009822406.1 hypothetical protein, variant 1 [Aphanomyces astaci]